MQDCCCVAALQYWQVLAEVPLESWLDGARQPDGQTSPSQGPLLPGDTSITWRGDGKYFATANRQSTGQPLPDQVACCL